MTARARRASFWRDARLGLATSSTRRARMKITKIDTFAVKGVSNAPWMFCAVRTDEGITGYSEFGNGNMAHGMMGIIKDLEHLLVGKDPRPVEKLFQ